MGQLCFSATSLGSGTRNPSTSREDKKKGEPRRKVWSKGASRDERDQTLFIFPLQRIL
ncbi:hypothetical protein CDL15_Pgr013761 [Punica granatum]|uniref:Uncharacterized protein n=1 Tax=Punica granatum TaxID=22663 RepID=A0A218W136_PUNGR|nr:hypothetical protein CDL15_Pgr013761 [Punica granatum]